jgi:anti-repressor protein
METKDLTIFEHSKFGNIRVHLDDKGSPWFCAKDVCKAIELQNPSKAIKSLDDDEKMTLTKGNSHSGQRGGAQYLSFVSEPGLYSLILRCKKWAVKQFKRWITHEVLPIIRQNGTYLTEQKQLELLTSTEAIHNFLSDALKMKERNILLEDRIKADLPKTHFYDKFAEKGANVTFGEMAAALRSAPLDASTGKLKLMNFARENGLLVREKNPITGTLIHRPSYKALEQGLLVEKIDIVTMVHMPMITPKGQIYFHDRFSAYGQITM